MNLDAVQVFALGVLIGCGLTLIWWAVDNIRHGSTR